MDFLVKGIIVLYIAKVKIKGKKIYIKIENKGGKIYDRNVYVGVGNKYESNQYEGNVNIKKIAINSETLKNPKALKVIIVAKKYVKNPEIIKIIEIILTILCFFIRSSLFIIHHYSECIPLN
jgi:hypothetical protein